MASFSLEVDGLDATLKGLGGLPEKATEAVWAGIQSTGFRALDKARSEAPKKTTTLARSITLEFDKDNLSATIFTNLEYSAIVEFGYEGPVLVFPHTRIQHMAWGRPITPRTVFVGGHFRFLDRKPQPYMQPAFKVVEETLESSVALELSFVDL